MSKVNVIIVGVDEWEKHTRPCIESICLQEPDVDITVVDAGSKEPYPSGDDYKLIRMDESKSYAQAINAGLRYNQESGRYDWYLITNNDTIYHKPFAGRIRGFDPNNISGFHIFRLKNRPYVSSFSFIIPDLVFSQVGFFDERFVPMGYEDADYCWRAIESGYGLYAMHRNEFGVEHLYNPNKEPFYKEPYKKLMEKYGYDL